MSLSDEIVKVDECDVINDSEWVNVEDIKEAVKELKERCSNAQCSGQQYCNAYLTVIEIIEDIFGEKLT